MMSKEQQDHHPASALPVGVVTVTYSPGEHLTRFLKSLEQATKRGTVTVMADNGSTDNYPEQAAAGNPDTVIFHSTGGNIGYGAAINKGVADILRGRKNAGAIDGEFFLISNPDVVLDAGAIDVLIDCARRHPRAGAVGPRISDPDGTLYPSARAVPDLSNGIGHALLRPWWKDNPFSKRYFNDMDMDHERIAGWVSGSCLLVRWAAFDEIGGFDERYFMYMEDVDFGDRLGRAGWTNVFCPDATIVHARGHAAGKLPAIMLPAHHQSAYRFLADRHPHWWQAPLRGALKVGLMIRARLAVVVAARRANG